MLEKDYKKIRTLALGESTTRPVYIKKMDDATSKNGPYVSFELFDALDSFKANMFQSGDGKAVTKENLAENGIVEDMLAMATIEKNDKGFLNVRNIGPNNDAEVTLKDFANKVPGSAEERYKNILEILQKVGEERKYTTVDDATGISDLAIQFYKEHHEELVWSSAAQMMHSEYAGGLMEHTEAMVRNAEQLCNIYPDLDKELLVSAAALHDIGKIEELNTSPLGMATYTAKGIGIGHIVLGYTYIDRMVQSNPGIYPEERVFLLETLLLSHHGEKQYGSPAEPIVKEAFMLNLIDQMDAKYHLMKRETEKINAGDISANSVFGIGHKIYRPIDED